MARSRRASVVVVSVALGAASPACGPTEPPSPPVAASSSPRPSASPGALAAIAKAITSAGATASAQPDAPLLLMKPPAVTLAEALDITFPAGAPAEAEACKSEAGADDAKIRCLLRVRFAGDTAARDMALGLYDRLGTVTGVGRDQTMDGGWRGSIHLVPELPVGQYRKHLQWVKTSFEDIDAFFVGLDAKRPKGTQSTYRYKALALRYIRSVGRTTPSAYAQDWEVSYNVSGSLHASVDAVRETLFHEIFHTNDARHGQWSDKALSNLVAKIVGECGQNSTCLAPYAPGTTMVRGGTYYAFQKGNGVGEYAAELATRYFLEHRAILAGQRYPRGAFKCGPPENAKAWSAIVDEFFGVDLTPECGAK